MKRSRPAGGAKKRSKRKTPNTWLLSPTLTTSPPPLEEAPTGTILVTDPSYAKAIWCSVTIPNCRCGRWKYVSRQDDDERIGASLITWVEDVSVSSLSWEPVMGRQGLGRSKPRKDKPMYAGLDTAQVGVFDFKRYPEKARSELHQQFYEEACCGFTLVKWPLEGEGAGEVMGVKLQATSDGRINVYVSRNEDGVVIGVRLGDSEEESE
eukprot:TRINITY_DN6108_c0_g1_i1.p1 TRINITY_DN6108_c0_g1~~TRINITY_DN6108_c0_g1_i1.p1  ORF type:complete len:209 (+),score=36.01 TRINITY_DN6108_c0_g1_i1:1-627(+)